MNDTHGSWKGIHVRSGEKKGQIVSDYAGFLHRNLTIAYEDGSEGFVQLNSNSKDSGDLGVEWQPRDTSHWYPLGDHNPKPKTKPTPARPRR